MGFTSNNYKHYTVAGTYPVSVNTTTLESVIVNTAAASSTITIKETDGSVIAVCDGASIHSRTYDLTNLNGLIVVIAAGNPDVTVTYQ